jgi:hypothetical protein
MNARTWKAPLAVGAPLLTFALLVASGPVDAKKKDEDTSTSACDKIKPEQRLSEEKEQELQSAISGAMVGIGKAGAEVDSSKSSTVSIQVLSEDALAKSWFIYQTCVMKEAGLLDDQVAQDLVAQLMGIRPTEVNVTVTDPATGARTTTSTSLGAGGSGQSYVEVWAPEPDAEVYIDGEAYGVIGAGTKLAVEPGNRNIQIRARGYKTVSRTVDVEEGTVEEVSVSAMEKKSKLWLWLLIGGLAVAAIVGVAAAVSGGYYDDYGSGDYGGDYGGYGGDYGGYY